MNKVIIVIIIVIVIGVVAYYLIGGTPMPAPNSSVSPSPSSTVMTPLAKVTVHIKNFAFNPASLAVKSGTEVTWVNDDVAPHTVTSDTGSLLNSGTLGTGKSWSVIFTSPGVAMYHCSIHPMMKGSVMVTP